MQCYLLISLAYADRLSGTGAARYGARWSSKGVHLIYAANSRALALAEVLPHFSLANMPYGYSMMTVSVPDALTRSSIDWTSLPPGWIAFPPTNHAQAIGDAFVRESQHLALRVPSATVRNNGVQQAFNLLINPRHDDFSQVRVLDQHPCPDHGRLFRP